MSERKAIDYAKTKFTKDEISEMRAEVGMIKQKHPGHIPVVVLAKDKRINLTKHKFLVKSDVTVGQFMFILRKKIEGDVASTESLFLFANNTLPVTSQLMSELYHLYQDKDTGLLFLQMCKENTFGALYLSQQKDV